MAVEQAADDDADQLACGHYDGEGQRTKRSNSVVDEQLTDGGEDGEQRDVVHGLRVALQKGECRHQLPLLQETGQREEAAEQIDAHHHL